MRVTPTPLIHFGQNFSSERPPPFQTGKSGKAIQATTAYCDYVHRRYGRFPAYTAPFRTVIGFQVCRVDLDFYERFYRPEATSDAVRANAESTLRGQKSTAP